jgi:hypothetical protein
MNVRIVLCLAMVLVFSFMAHSLSYPDSATYTNKDVEVLKQSHKGTAAPPPSPSPQNAAADPGNGKVFNNSDVKDLKSKDVNTQYKKKDGEKTKGSISPSKNTVNYQSPDGSIKVEVKSGKTLTNKDVKKLKTSDKGKAYGRSTREAQNMSESEKTKLAITITEIPVLQKMLPCEDWKEEYEAYFQRHNNDTSLILDPKIIVIRSTNFPSVDALWNVWKQGSLYDEGDDGPIYGHLSCHFIVDKMGTIHQLLPLNLRSKGAYGVNHCAITIETIGLSNGDILNNIQQKQAVYSLVSVIMKKFGIPLSKVYGHHEVAQGKSLVAEYTDKGDSDYPLLYSPDKVCYDPGDMYMQQMRNHFARQTSRGQ